MNVAKRTAAVMVAKLQPHVHFLVKHLPLSMTSINTGQATMKKLQPYQRRRMHYLTSLKDVVPPGRVVVHNKVRPSIRLRLGWSGFRAWHQKLNDTLVVCACGWGPKFGTHYIPKAVAEEDGNNKGFDTS
jgi:hypothetical protein